MTEDLTPEDLDVLDGEPLPDREAMSILPVDGGFSIPVDPDAGAGHTQPVESPQSS